MNRQFFLKQLVSGGLLTLAISAMADDSPTATALTVMTNDNGVLVEDAGRPVLQYQLKVKSANGRWPRSNYIHPLYDLNGNVITEDFPDDHGHHRGIFWAWHQVLVGETRMGDAWACRDFEWDVQSSTSKINSDGSATVSAQLLWKSSALKDDNGQMLAAVREHTHVTVHPATSEQRLIDFDIHLVALLPDVRIGGSEDDKGYGGFSPRIRLSADQTFASSTGTVQPMKTAITAGSWMNISNADFGFAMLCHPENPGFPEPWILRSERSMQNAVYPGATAVALPTDSPLRLRYRLVVHSGTNSTLNFSALQTQYGQ
ncbi:MAG: DUF6807 family protein [Planctomycetaceae bacterium]